MALCRLIFFMMLFGVWPLGAAPEQFTPGTTHRLFFRDVDGNDLSTSDGHVTILTVVTRVHEDKARIVADLVPDRYIGGAKYYYITLVNFERKVPRPFYGLTRAIIRSLLAVEASKLKPDYVAKKIARDPRSDLHVVADFDGRATEQVGMSADAGKMAVFVFDGSGKLIARWSDVPPGDSLAEALAEAKTGCAGSPQ